MATGMLEAWIIDAARTPRGMGKADKGALANIHPQRILSQVLVGLTSRTGFDVSDVDDVVIGCSAQIGPQSACIARMAALDADWPVSAVGVTLDRFCGSGLTAINIATMGILSGMQHLVVAGGIEQMSYTFAQAGSAFIDNNNLHLRAIHPQPHQGVCADVIATLEGFSRDDADRFALESQRRADHAIRHGHFERSLIPVRRDDGGIALDHEEFPRPTTTLAGLAQLNPSFAPYYDIPLDETGTSNKSLVERKHPGLQVNHIHHAGNSSGVVDGAAAIVIASPTYARARGLTPRARIISVATAGDSPELMLNATVPAARRALALAGMEIDDIDLFEINEAFAVVPLKFMRDLGIDPSKVNVNGGAIALGHPIGATGAVILGTLLDELERRDLRTGLVTLCAGGGMAPCLILERI